MKTIFDFDPTDEELVSLFGMEVPSRQMIFGFSILPQDSSKYTDLTSDEEKILDIAQLMEFRGDDRQARKYWDQIPLIEQQYRGGFDFAIKYL